MVTGYLIGLACGHSGRLACPPRKGDWISCWALTHPQPGCQAQRKVVSVMGQEAPFPP